MFSIIGLVLMNSTDLTQVLQSFDISHILVLTDEQYLALPETLFHPKHPWNIYLVTARVSKLKNLLVRVVMVVTRHNTECFFNL